MSSETSFVNVQTLNGTLLSLFPLRLRETSADEETFIGSDVRRLFERSSFVKVADQSGISGIHVILLCDRFRMLRLGSWRRPGVMLVSRLLLKSMSVICVQAED